MRQLMMDRLFVPRLGVSLSVFVAKGIANWAMSFVRVLNF